MLMKRVLTLGFTAAMVASLASPAVAQMRPGHGAGGPGREGMEQLNLTAEQRSALAELREQMRTQVESVLTADQREQLRAEVTAGTDPRSAMRQLDLTEDQRDQLRQIHEENREAMQAILTEEQQEQLREGMRGRPGHRGQGQGRPGQRGAGQR